MVDANLRQVERSRNRNGPSLYALGIHHPKLWLPLSMSF